MSSSGFALSLFLQFGVQNLICFKGYGPTDSHFSTCVVSRFLLFTDQSKLLVLAIGIAQLLAQLQFGNWYCICDWYRLSYWNSFYMSFLAMGFAAHWTAIGLAVFVLWLCSMSSTQFHLFLFNCEHHAPYAITPPLAFASIDLDHPFSKLFHYAFTTSTEAMIWLQFLGMMLQTVQMHLNYFCFTSSSLCSWRCWWKPPAHLDSDCFIHYQRISSQYNQSFNLRSLGKRWIHLAMFSSILSLHFSHPSTLPTDLLRWSFKPAHPNICFKATHCTHYSTHCYFFPLAQVCKMRNLWRDLCQPWFIPSLNIFFLLLVLTCAVFRLQFQPLSHDLKLSLFIQPSHIVTQPISHSTWW